MLIISNAVYNQWQNFPAIGAFPQAIELFLRGRTTFCLSIVQITNNTCMGYGVNSSHFNSHFSCFFIWGKLILLITWEVLYILIIMVTLLQSMSFLTSIWVLMESCTPLLLEFSTHQLHKGGSLKLMKVPYGGMGVHEWYVQLPFFLYQIDIFSFNLMQHKIQSEQ